MSRRSGGERSTSKYVKLTWSACGSGSSAGGSQDPSRHSSATCIHSSVSATPPWTACHTRNDAYRGVNGLGHDGIGVVIVKRNGGAGQVTQVTQLRVTIHNENGCSIHTTAHTGDVCGAPITAAAFSLAQPLDPKPHPVFRHLSPCGTPLGVALVLLERQHAAVAPLAALSEATDALHRSLVPLPVAQQTNGVIQRRRRCIGHGLFTTMGSHGAAKHGTTHASQVHCGSLSPPAVPGHGRWYLQTLAPPQAQISCPTHVHAVQLPCGTLHWTSAQQHCLLTHQPI